MYRVVCLLLLLIFLVPLSCDVFDSNELFQRLSEKDELEFLGWELQASSDKDVLFFDGEIKGEKIFYPDGYEKKQDGRSERVFSDKSGNVVRRIIKEGDGIEEYNYFYSNNALASYTYSVDEHLIKKVDYIDADGRLVSISGSSDAYFTRESIVYRDAEGKAVAIYASDLKPVQSSSDIDEEGNLTEIVDGVLYTYSPEGRLESKESDDFSVRYTYSEDGSLLVVDTSYGDVRIIDEFENSIKVKSSEYRSGAIEKVKTYPEEGIVEEIRYFSGKPRYRMIFDMDGQRLKEVLPL